MTSILGKEDWYFYLQIFVAKTKKKIVKILNFSRFEAQILNGTNVHSTLDMGVTWTWN